VTDAHEGDRLETRIVATDSSLSRDRDRNTLVASGSEAAALLACARDVARMPPEEAIRWWRGERQVDGVAAQPPLEMVQWAIEGAYAEHLGDFTRWMFTAPPRACIPGEGDREAANSLEAPLATFVADVAAKALPPATEAARRGSLIAQVDAFALLSEPMLAEKRDALSAIGCPALARWADAARMLTSYFASSERAALSPQSLGRPSVTGGLFSLDFPHAAPPPSGVELHRWWTFCEAQFVIALRDGLPDAPGFLFASGALRGKLHYRLEDGKRQVLYAAQSR
jgi:hypothetical protein